MKKVTVKRLKRHIDVALEKRASTVAAFKGNENPQVKEMYDRALGQMSVLQDLSDAINRNDFVGLRTLSGLSPE